MKVYPKKHDQGQQIQTAVSIVLVCIEKVVPDYHEKQRENMRPGEPVDLRRYQREQDDQDIKNDVPLVDPYVQGIGQGYQKGKKNHHPREAGNPVKDRHDDLGKPLVGCPGKRRRMVGKNIVLRNRTILQNIIPRPDVVSRVRVGEHVFPRGRKRQNEKDDQEEELTD
jgi:hypothetical protein